MEYKVISTEEQDLGFAIKLQEENARRLKPVALQGKVVRLPQLTADEYIQAIYNDVAEQGLQQQKALREVEFQEKLKIVLEDPETRRFVEDKFEATRKKKQAL